MKKNKINKTTKTSNEKILGFRQTNSYIFKHIHKFLNVLYCLT